MDYEWLVARARLAAERAYAPYSKFRVGAALLAGDGSVTEGANVENLSYGLTICAERSAISAAVSAGKRGFAAIAVACVDAQGPVPPCGACRQVIAEFLPPDAPVLIADPKGGYVESSVAALLPMDTLGRNWNREAPK
jgi:cytidine deaminase